MHPAFPLLFLASTAVSPSDPEDLYRRCVERSLERAQTELLARIDLWADHSRWEDPWVVTTEHFEVRTVESHALAAEMGKGLEYMRGEWEKLLGRGSAAGGKARIWIFPDLAAYNAFGQSYAEHTSMYGSFYADQHPDRPVATYFTPNQTLLGMWITHSATHQFVEQGFGTQPPLWIAEGLAAYFALHWDWDYGARELERLDATKRFIPLERLTADPIQAYLPTADERLIELGMFFHYLLDSCEETKTGAGGDPEAAPFRDFLRAVVRGQDPSRTEVARVLEEDAALIEQDFRSFDFAAR